MATAFFAAAAAAAPDEQPTRITSWNAWSVQFIDPPVFQLLALPGTRAYRAVVEQGGKTWRVDSETPRLALSRADARAFGPGL